MPVSKYEKLEQCPYEKSHLITPDKLITHLTKCRKQHLKKFATPNIVVCPYKSIHHVPRSELDHHVKNCDGRDLAVHMLLDPSNANTKKRESSTNIGQKEIRNCEVVTDDEDWETQQIKAPYDPASKIMEMEVTRKPVGLTKSERQEFYANERKRRQFLAERREDLEKQSSSNPVNEGGIFSTNSYNRASTSQMGKQMGQLRRPKQVATPTRAIYSPVLPKSEEMLDSNQQPRLRRPNCVMPPTKNHKETVDTLAQSNENTGNEDPYNKYVEEKMKQMNI